MNRISFYTAILFSIFLLACKSQEQYPPGEGTATDTWPDSVLAFVRSAPVISEGSGSPFDSIIFDRIIAYEFNGKEKENSRIINDSGQLVPTVRKQKFLTEDQARNITACLTDTLSYGEGTRSCFAPSEALVFFQGTKPVMTVDICLDCNYLESSIPIPARNAKQLIVDGRKVPGIGFSSAGRDCLVKLSRELGLVYGHFK